MNLIVWGTAGGIGYGLARGTGPERETCRQFVIDIYGNNPTKAFAICDKSRVGIAEVARLCDDAAKNGSLTNTTAMSCGTSFSKNNLTYVIVYARTGNRKLITYSFEMEKGADGMWKVIDLKEQE